LPIVAGVGDAHQATERCTKDEASHCRTPSFPAGILKAMFVPRIGAVWYFG
jgi:hypothetical protein